MCENSKQCQGVCPAAKALNFIPREESCGKNPSELPNTMEMLRQYGDFLPPITRAINGHLIEAT